MTLYQQVALLVALVTCDYVQAEKLCMEDTDCGSLGDLICVKSVCEWGICGCERGYAARYVGATKEFKCLTMAHIGENCSTDDDEDGVCAASNAECSNGECVCKAGYISRSDGEDCVSEGTVYPSESCSSGLGSNCQYDSNCKFANNFALPSYSGLVVESLTRFHLDETPNSCYCPIGSHTVLVNEYSASPFLGAKVPKCVTNAVGELCVQDEDCGLIQMADGMGDWTTTDAAMCTDEHTCACANASHVPDITGLFCAQALSYGDQCMVNFMAVSSDVGICDGSAGQRCGSPCDHTTLYGSGNYTCVCDPGWSESGITCSRKSVGDFCYGDHNCKSISDRAVCRDNLCESGVAAITVSMVTLMSSLLVTLMGHA